MTGIEQKKHDLAEETKKRFENGKDDAGQYPASGKVPNENDQQRPANPNDGCHLG